MESKNLTTELKKRYLKLKGRYAEAEAEIQRLTKTVKVVEIQVDDDVAPYKEKIQQLKDENFDLATENTRLQDTVSSHAKRIQELEHEVQRVKLQGERYTVEISQFNDKIRQMEEDLRFKSSDLDQAQYEIRGYQEKLGQLESKLAEASLYKDWYDDKVAELETVQKQLDEEQNKNYALEDDKMNLNEKLQQEKQDGEELRQMVKDL